jgi:predicted N-acetyltransferase YhbS
VPAVFEVKEATAGDHEEILSLILAAFGASNEPMVRLRLEGPQGNVARWTVVRDHGRVVSTCTLLPFDLTLDGVAVPAGQLEFVVSDPGHQRQGLIRRQFEVLHRRSAEAGHVVQFILGIPYFYRRLGYGYGVDHPGLLRARPEALAPDPTIVLRAATPADLDGLDATTLGRGRAADGLGTDHGAALHRRMWAAQLSDPPGSGSEQLYVAERGDDLVGLSAITVWSDQGRCVHVPTLAADRAVSDALVTHALGVARSRGHELILQETGGAGWNRHLAAVGHSMGPWPGVYARVPDPVAFLLAVRPVLAARLRASPFADATGGVTISLYDDAVHLAFAAGEITGVTRVARIEDPTEEDECGVAPDWFPALVLGRWGARGLEERIDDVFLGRHGDLLEVLFPRRPADIVDGF